MIQNLVRRQNDTGHDARVLTLDRPAGSDLGPLSADEVVAGIPVHRISWRGSSRYPFAPTVLRHLGQADLLHVHGIDFFFDALALTRAIHRRPMVASTHGGFFHSGFMQRAKKIWFHSITRVSTVAYDGIVANSQSDAKMFAQLQPRLIRTIANGVDVRKWAECGSDAPVKQLIYFGRFATHKRIGAAFALLRHLREHDGAWRLTVAGSPADVTADQLRTEAADLGPAVTVVVRPEKAALAKLIEQAGYFICPSSYEGFGIAAVEAMSAGLIPVLSDIPPFRRLIAGETDAMLLDPDQPAAAADRPRALHGSVSPQWSASRARRMASVQVYD